MFSWITGPRITNVIEDLQTDPAYDTTFLEPPDTPAHQFAVKAFKHALFGTPAPDDANSNNRLEKRATADAKNAKNTDLPAPKEPAVGSSPTKQPNGILMTPGTVNKGRKTVSFGKQVVDNEGKKGNAGRSGIPSDCPGKFPSPWTPGTELKADVGSDKKRTKLTEALYDARSTAQPKSGQKPKARDDSDITLDLGAPRSESGKYWKEQYEVYAKRSEKEMKQLVAKQQLAKNYAKKKDDEATSLTNQRDEERKRFRSRERQLEQQIKELQEHLRKATSEKNAADMTNALLKKKVEELEKTSSTAPKPNTQDDKLSFSIYEDPSKDSSHIPSNQIKPSRERRGTASNMSAVFAADTTGILPENKENSPPKSRRTRRQTLPDSSHHRRRPSQSAPTTSDQDPNQVSSLFDILKLDSTQLPPKSPLSIRKPNPSKENISTTVTSTTKPTDALLSSPLPLPSPNAFHDPWLDLDADVNASPLPQKKDIQHLMSSVPISTAPPTRATHDTKPTATTTRPNRLARSTQRISKPDIPVRNTSVLDTTSTAAVKLPRTIAPTEQANPNISHIQDPFVSDSKFDISKSAAHHANTTDVGASSMMAGRKDRVALPVDRKELARIRLMERKKRKGGVV